MSNEKTNEQAYKSLNEKIVSGEKVQGVVYFNYEKMGVPAKSPVGAVLTKIAVSINDVAKDLSTKKHIKEDSLYKADPNHNFDGHTALYIVNMANQKLLGIMKSSNTSLKGREISLQQIGKVITTSMELYKKSLKDNKFVNSNEINKFEEIASNSGGIAYISAKNLRVNNSDMVLSSSSKSDLKWDKNLKADKPKEPVKKGKKR